MIMKVVAHGPTREQAIDRLHDALADLHIVGITHNTRYLQAVLRHPAFRAAELHTGFLGAVHSELLSA